MQELEQLCHGLRAVVFDFDGVILESGHIKTEAFLELFADWPEHREAVLAFHLANLGVSRYVKFRYVVEALWQRPYTPQDEAALGAAFEGLVLDKVLRCPFVPGAAETLAAIQGRLPAFVASGTPQAELDFIVTRRDLRGSFQEVWGTPCTKPDILGDIVARYGWQPDEVLMVGDGLSDYQAAQAVGTRFLARLTPEQQAEWDKLDVVGVDDLRGLAQVVGVDTAVAIR
ncbi:MAG: HAD hydrolase-like protein [Anaerolineae bacterium]|nr:HAD hydrolase-like protein [Anaerolineae bacterium]